MIEHYERWVVFQHVSNTATCTITSKRECWPVSRWGQVPVQGCLRRRWRGVAPTPWPRIADLSARLEILGFDLGLLARARTLPSTWGRDPAHSAYG
jgi:hypothetical protein